MSLLDYAQGRDLLNQALARSSASGALASRKAALRLHQIASRTFANALRYAGNCVFFCMEQYSRLGFIFELLVLIAYILFSMLMVRCDHFVCFADAFRVWYRVTHSWCWALVSVRTGSTSQR